MSDILIKKIMLIDDEDFNTKEPDIFINGIRKTVCSQYFVDDDAELIVLSQKESMGSWSGETLRITSDYNQTTKSLPCAKDEGIIKRISSVGLNTVEGGIFVFCDYVLKRFQTLKKYSNLEGVEAVMSALDNAVVNSILLFVIYTSLDSIDANDKISLLREYADSLNNVWLIPQVLLFFNGRAEENIPGLKRYLRKNQNYIQEYIREYKARKEGIAH